MRPTNAASGSGLEDAASITVALSGSDVDGTVASFTITSLPANGLLYADVGLSTLLNLNDSVPASGNAATVYFVPDPDWNGSTSFDYAAVDDQGATDATPATASITVTPVNDAPLLDNAGNPILHSIVEDMADASNAGDLVANLVGASLTDVDNGALQGIAITSLGTANGHWEYQLASGGGWTAAPAVSATSALLVDVQDSLRFVPNADYSGTAALTYQAWDETSGSPGGVADASVNGGATAFSSASETATIDVAPVADAPTFTIAGEGPT